MVDLKVRSKADEEISEAKIRQVIWMLKQGKTKKACCEHLGIAYNTKRLEKLITEFKEGIEREKELQIKARSKILSESDKLDIVQSYESGESVAAIAKQLYLTAPRIKAVLIEKNVPIRSRGNKSANVDHVIQDLDQKFQLNQKVFIPKLNSFGYVKEVFDEEWLDYHKQGRQVYFAYVDHDKLPADTVPREGVHYEIMWQLPNGKEWKLNALKNMINVWETAIEESGREYYRILVEEGEYKYYANMRREELFPVASEALKNK